MAEGSNDKADKAVVDLQLANLPGDTVEAKTDAAIKSSPVVVFSKSSCPFCLEVKRTFDSLGVPFNTFELDTIADGAKAQAALKAKTGQATVPFVFIGGELVGGCDATKAAQSDGSLLKKLAAQGIFPKPAGSAGTALTEGSPRALSTLFSFPEVVDDRVARFNGIWGFIICLLVAVFHWTPQATWVMGGLLVDFILRFLGGSNISPLGSLSNLCVAVMEMFGSKPRWVAGQSKQFASLCGVMFAFLAFFFYRVAVHNDKLTIVGLAFTCGLGGATFLEGFVGFCLGCWMFGLAVDFGFLPKEVFMVYTNARDEADYTWNDMNKRLNEGAPTSHRLLIHPDGVTQTSIDFMYKAKTDDMIREDFNIIKHVKITHFMAHMGLAGLACAWRYAAPFDVLYAPTPVQYAIALTAALTFVIWLGLYAIKWFKYPAKVQKEWMHNLSGNAFVVPWVTTVLFAYLVVEHSLKFAHVLFWIGAPMCLALSFVRVGDWIAFRKDLEHLNASWMFMPVSNAVVALVGPFIEVKYTDACQFWFAVAFMMWLLLFAATFYKAIIHIEEDDRNRPAMAVWIAAPAVLAVAYLQVFHIKGQQISLAALDDDFIFVNLHWFAVSITLILLWCFIRPFFGRMRFEMAYWAAGFPTAALAITCIAYYQVKPGGLSKGIAYTALATASALNCVLCLQTLAALLRRRVFVPDAKWGPLSFMRLTHEAFRGALSKLSVIAEIASSDSTRSAEVVASLQQSWQLVSLAHDEHSKHEDQAIFKLYDEFYPGIAQPYNDEHDSHHELIKQVNEGLSSLAKGPSAAAAQALATSLKSYTDDLLVHLKREEDHLVGMPRKHINLTLHKETVRKCWELTPATTWQQLLPWIINSLPMLHQRVRFIKTLLWAMPERAQHIGMMVGLGVDPVQWKRITDELPEIIPRAAPGWTRYY